MLILRAAGLSFGCAVLAGGLSLGTVGVTFAQDGLAVAPPRPDRVALVATNDPDGLSSLPDCALRFFAEAPSHLVVFAGGDCILDRGLRSEGAQDIPEGGGHLERSGLVESAWVAPDGRGALLATLRFTDRVRLVDGGDRPAEDGLRAATTLTWIEPSHPGGRFEVELEPGRVVKDAAALPLGFGAALLTQTHDADAVDFRLYDLAGEMVLRVPEREASALGVGTTTLGGFVLVDLALSSSPSGPDRALRVYDLLQGRSWDYTWSYGSESEPLSWSLEDSGVLEVSLPGATRRFDRNGHALGGSRTPRETGRRSRLPINRLRD